jgi:hypothetical protein
MDPVVCADDGRGGKDVAGDVAYDDAAIRAAHVRKGAYPEPLKN